MFAIKDGRFFNAQYVYRPVLVCSGAGLTMKPWIWSTILKKPVVLAALQVLDTIYINPFSLDLSGQLIYSSMNPWASPLTTDITHISPINHHKPYSYWCMFLQDKAHNLLSPPTLCPQRSKGGTLFDLFISTSRIAEFGLRGRTSQQQLFGRPGHHGEAMSSHPQI